MLGDASYKTEKYLLQTKEIGKRRVWFQQTSKNNSL